MQQSIMKKTINQMKTFILAETPGEARAYVDAMTKSERGDGFYTVTDHILN